MAELFPIYGDSANFTNFIASTSSAADEPALYAEFDAGCSLMQTSADGWIYTGPIVLNTDLPDLEYVVLPGGRPYAIVNAAGNVISQPVPGQAFFIRTPATAETYMLTLYAYVNNCFQLNEEQNLGASADVNPYTRHTLHQLMINSGRAPLLFEGLFPDCYLVYARLAFYINQKPNNNCKKKTCITMPGVVAGASDGTMSFSGCCRCGCGS